MGPDVPVISAHYDRDNNRVAITVEPCLGADCFSVSRSPIPELTHGQWVHGLQHVPATGERQTFYDYTCPLNASPRYRVLSYAKRADGLLCGAADYSTPVTVDTTDDRHWLKDR